MEKQLEIVEELVKDAVEKGAAVLAGGKRNESLADGFYFEPTLLAGVTRDMDIANKETFGPVMLVFKFASEEQVVAEANASDFALGSSIFTTDYAKADRVGRRLANGMVNVNEWGIGALIYSLPFGGRKHSGFGRFSGVEGLRDFCHVQSVVTDRFPLRSPSPGFMSFPVPRYGPDILREIVSIIYAHGLRAKLRHCREILSVIVKHIRSK